MEADFLSNKGENRLIFV